MKTRRIMTTMVCFLFAFQAVFCQSSYSNYVKTVTMLDDGGVDKNVAVQFKSLVRKYHLSKDEKEILHNEISHQGYGYHEIEQLFKELFNKK